MPLPKSLTKTLLAYTMLSNILGSGIGPGVSQDRRPLPYEGGAYQFNDTTRHEYENAMGDRRQKRRKDDLLFEQFYRRSVESQ